MTLKKTNAEARVDAYDDRMPTDSSTVTPTTPLEALNLNWTERELPERIRTKHVHRLHPYLGKYIPQLVEVFLRKYFLPGQTVFDPFAGSGTTLVQANELGIHAVGCDISAFNVLLSRVKTARYDIQQLSAEIQDSLKRFKQITALDYTHLPLFGALVPVASSEGTPYLQAWFAATALEELLRYRDIIERGTYDYKDLLRVILSRAARSARLTTHFDLDFPKKPQTEPYWCYKHRRTCAPTTEAGKFIRRYALDTLKRVEIFSHLRTDARVEVFNIDSRIGITTPIDGMITSPPYVGLIDYHAQHSYAYQLLGISDRSTEEIGPASGGTSRRARTQYQDDITLVFQKALDQMPSGGVMIVIAGDRANLYPDIAARLDVTLEAVKERHVNRRTGRRSGEFFESVFIWRKR